LSQAAGIALARRQNGETGKTWVFMSDGEFEEGQTYEAVQAMAHYELDTVGVYVDVNGQQVDGPTDEVMNIEPLSSRLQAFGAHVETVDGHDLTALEAASRVESGGKPLFILCYTNTAQGVPLLEERKPYLHFVRFKSADEKQKLQEFLETM
jgi:transketolase